MSVVIVTGASRGIGAATAILAARKGYSVIVNYHRNEESANQVVERIVADGGYAFAVAADISVETQVISLFDKAISRFGQIDALVNNAGILEQHMKLESMTVERMRRVFSTNVIGTMLCAREAVKHMSIKRGGSGGGIVNVSSIAADLGAPNEYVDYAASKGAIDTFTKGLAIEVADDGIRINTVRPGVIYTDIHASGGEPDRVDRIKQSVPMQRGGSANEVAHAILWLLSEEASYTTGAMIDVTGGR